MVPVVGARTDNHHVLAVGEFAVATPFSGELDQRVTVDSGVLLLPGGRVGHVLVVIALGVEPGQSTLDPEASHEQIERCRYFDRPVGGFDDPNGNRADDGAIISEEVEFDLDYLVVLVDEAELRLDGLAGDHILKLQVPVALLLFGPPIANGTVRHAGCVGRLVPHEELPISVFDVPIRFQSVGAHVLAGHPVIDLE